jgi:hypothetical protein
MLSFPPRLMIGKTVILTCWKIATRRANRAASTVDRKIATRRADRAASTADRKI